MTLLEINCVVFNTVVVIFSILILFVQQILKWLPSVDPQGINVVTSGREGSTEGEVTIISYDLMVRRKVELGQRKFKVVIMVSLCVYLLQRKYED